MAKMKRKNVLIIKVFVGQHRLLALKGLFRIGKLEQLPGINNRKITNANAIPNESQCVGLN